MICGNCDKEDRATLKTDGVAVWVQKRCGSGKNSEIVRACDVGKDGKAYAALGVTNISNVQRGAATVEYAQDCSDSCKKVLVSRTYGDPPDKTVDITMNLKCGGYRYNELMQGKIDLYFEVNCCCGQRASDFSQVNEYFVMRGVDMSIGYSISNLTQIDNGDPQNVQLSFSGVGFDDWQHIQQLAANRIGTSGAAIVSSLQLKQAAGCDADDCKNNQWAWIDNEGTLTIYGEDGTTTVFSIPTEAGSDAGATQYWLTQIGNKLYIWYSAPANAASEDGFVCVSLDKYCNPEGDWANTVLTGQEGLVRITNVCTIGSETYISGAGGIWVYSTNGTLISVLDAPTGLIRDIAKCGGTITATGPLGGVYKSSGCVNSFELLTTPTGGNHVSIDVISSDEIYVIDVDGTVSCSIDCGENWDPVAQVPLAPNFANQVNFYDANVGYITGGGTAYQTGTGGESWSDTFLEQVPAFTALNVLPDCDDINCVLMVGTEAGAGAAYLYKPASC